MAKQAKARSGRSSFNENRDAAALKALHEYQRTMNRVIEWSFWDRLQVSYYVITKGLPIRAILLYALIQVLSIPRNKHRRPLVLAAVMLLLLIPLYLTYQA